MDTAGHRIRVGCAGWSLPSQYRSRFDGSGSMLARYASRLPAVEINSSFYRPHQRKTYERWAASVPRDFRFSVKLPREISHERALRGCLPVLDTFLEQVDGLGPKLGGLLLQLPPSLAFDARSASAFLQGFRRRCALPLACEPRHASWFADRAEAMLERHDVSRVAADPARIPEAARPGASPRWRYWRWHGSPRMYYSRYPREALQSLAAEVARTPGGAAWVIFDNTAHGFATGDALDFLQIAGKRRGARRA